MRPEKLTQFLIKSIGARRRVLVKGKPGIGKCLAKGTPVLRYDGITRKVEAIREGDLLMGPDSQPRTVTAITQGTGQLYKVTPTKGSPYVVNENHVLSLYLTGGLYGDRPHRGHVNITVSEYLMKSDNWKEHAKGWRTGADWPSSKVAIPPYILGLWLGDGDSQRVAITSGDLPVIEAWSDYGLSVGLTPVHYSTTNEHTEHVALTQTPQHKHRSENCITVALRHYGLIGCKHIPFAYLFNDRAFRLELLAGLIDTDGSLVNGCFDIIQLSPELSDDIVFLARSLGFAAYSKISVKGCQGGFSGEYVRITISGDISHIPTRLAHKKAGVRAQKKSVLRTGIKVESIGIGEYFGFSLDGDGLFLLGDFTVTHNSDIVAQAAQAVGAELVLMHPSISDPTDYKGMPALTGNGEAHFLPFGDLSKLCKTKKLTVAFLDDIGQAAPAVQAALMQLILARSVNGTTISPEVVFVGATNDTSHMAGVSGMIEPLKSRWDTIVELEVSVDDWSAWSLDAGLPAELVAFIRFRPALLSDFKPTKEIRNSPCPRTWASVGNWLLSGVKDLEVFTGAVGEGAATEFYSFLDLYASLPSLDAILLDPVNAPVPEKPAALFAVATGLARKATPQNLERVTRYYSRLPKEFEVLGMRDTMRLDKKGSMQICPAFVSWATRNAAVLSGGKA